MLNHKPKNNPPPAFQFKRQSPIQKKNDSKANQNSNPFSNALAQPKHNHNPFQTALKTPKTISNPFQTALNSALQTKLSIGQANDHYEKEADQVADQVVNMSNHQPLQRKCTACESEERIQTKSLASQITPLNTGFTQKKCAACDTEEQLQGKFMQKQNEAGSQLESQVSSHKGGGSQMDHTTEAEMNQKFGADFSGVRIHTGSQSVQMNQDLGARAFTVGNDIHFNQGEYNPGSQQGKRLLAHELTHTLQQNDAPTIQKVEIKGFAENNYHFHNLLLKLHHSAQSYLSDAITATAKTDSQGNPTADVIQALEIALNVGQGFFANNYKHTQLSFALEPLLNRILTVLVTTLVGSKKVKYRKSLGYCSGANAHTYNKITICPNFWSYADDDKRAMILIHEWSHIYGSGVRRFKETYCHQESKWSKHSLKKRLKMPDFYERYISNLVVTDSKGNPKDIC